MTAGMLDGITVLDLASVGPAARASRWLADYGAEVVKVGPVPAQGGVQITPPFYAYSAGRGTKRVLLDLKAPDGREAFLRLAEGADVVIESFRPGVADRLGVGGEAVRARNPRAVYCSTSGYGQDGPHGQWAGHDLDYLAVGGYLHCGGRGPDGKPPLPGATVADSAGGGMHAVDRHPRRARASQRHGRGRLPRRLGGRRRPRPHGPPGRRAPRHRERAGPGSSLLTGRYACYDTYRAADGRWLAVAAIEPKFWANLCRALGLERWVDAQLDDAVQDEVRADVQAAFATRSRDEWVAELAPADTCVAPVLSVAEVVDDPQFVARGAFAEAVHPTEGRFRPGGPDAGRHPPSRGRRRRARGHRHRHRRAARRRRRRARALRRAAGGRGGRMSETTTSEVPDEVTGWIGEVQYEEEGEFPVERGYVWTSCASVENGNPLFWDDEVAEALTGGPIAPPTMLSVWFRPHHWAPGRTEQALPLQVHFDLKDRLDLPEAVMTDNTIVFHEPVRPGDRLRTSQILRSVSEEKTTKLGTGRFWVIDVEYRNQDGALVGVESYTGFGYRRSAA